MLLSFITGPSPRLEELSCLSPDTIFHSVRDPGKLALIERLRTISKNDPEQAELVQTFLDLINGTPIEAPVVKPTVSGSLDDVLKHQMVNLYLQEASLEPTLTITHVGATEGVLSSKVYRIMKQGIDPLFNDPDLVARRIVLYSRSAGNAYPETNISAEIPASHYRSIGGTLPDPALEDIQQGGNVIVCSGAELGLCLLETVSNIAENKARQKPVVIFIPLNTTNHILREKKRDASYLEDYSKYLKKRFPSRHMILDFNSDTIIHPDTPHPKVTLVWIDSSSRVLDYLLYLYQFKLAMYPEIKIREASKYTEILRSALQHSDSRKILLNLQRLRRLSSMGLADPSLQRVLFPMLEETGWKDPDSHPGQKKRADVRNLAA
ncbi:MAG: hypothetical protein JW774_02370 [Candidatus Aureabacteria bacterium]|nr:hypothetical protein [Candidatus Auribacterota bacterium]